MQYNALMDALTDTLTKEIGERIKHARKTHSLTLEKLAEAANLSRRMLINIEKGETNPSIGILLRLSEALGIALPELVAPPKQDTISITPAGTASILWQGKNGGTAKLVASKALPAALELWHWHLAAHESHTSTPHTTGATELIHVLSGTLTLTVGTETHTLQQGDAASFKGDKAHSYSNSTDSPCVFSLTVYEPTKNT